MNLMFNRDVCCNKGNLSWMSYFLQYSGKVHVFMPNYQLPVKFVMQIDFQDTGIVVL